MKSLLLLLIALSFCGNLSAFPDLSPERLKANKAWEKRVRAEFDLVALRAFLAQKIAEQKQFDGTDLTASIIGEKWKIDSHHRHLACGSWLFKCDDEGAGFQLRYSPDKGDRDVVLVCERTAKKSFRLIEIKWEPKELTIAKGRTPLILPSLGFARPPSPH